MGTFTVLVRFGIVDWQSMGYSFDLWLTTLITLAFLSLLVLISMSMLVQRLEQSLRQAREANLRLETQIAERRQAEAALFRRNTQLEALRQSGLLVSAELDLRALLRSIAAQATRLLGGYGGVVHLYRPDLDALERVVATYVDADGIDPNFLRLGTLLERGKGLAGRIWEIGEPLVVDDYALWEGRATIADHYPFRAAVGVPIRWGSEFLGVVNVNAREIGAFSNDDVAVLSLFAAQAATAIRNARLYERIQRSEQAVRESEQMLRLIFDNAFDGISIYRDAPDGSRVLLSCNDRYVEMSGRSRQALFDVVDTRHFQIALEQDLMAYIKNIQTRQPHSGFFSWLRPDERENVIAYTAVPVETAGDVWIVGIDRDITEQRRAERERRELRERLERAERMEALGILAGGVAHDLNNILGPLVAYPDLILMELPPNSPLGDDIKQIKASAERAAAVVQDLLTLARRGAYRMAPLDLNHLIDDYTYSLPFAELKARNPNVLVEIDLAQDLFNIKGSAAHLTKVLMNLASNSFEAMPYGGRLEIRTACESLDRPLAGYERIEAGDYVVLHLGDTGVGIAEEDLVRIFEPFYTKKVMGRSGSGLGLAVVWGVVHDHEGAIDVCTALGQGTEFALYFPVTREQVNVDDGRQRDHRGVESVLVIDDLAVQREIAVRLLSLLGYDVTAVESGQAALAHLSQHGVDILVLDMILDDQMDGLDVYRAILEHHPQQKAIIASGFSETERVREAQRLGAGAFVKKPYTLECLGEAVRAELDR